MTVTVPSWAIAFSSMVSIDNYLKKKINIINLPRVDLYHSSFDGAEFSGIMSRIYFTKPTKNVKFFLL